MASGDMTIKNTNVASNFTNTLWQTGLKAAKTDDSLQTKENAAFVKGPESGVVRFRFWELEQDVVLSPKGNSDVTGTGANDGNVIVISAPATEAEKAYYKSLNGVAGLVVTVAA